MHFIALPITVVMLLIAIAAVDRSDAQDEYVSNAMRMSNAGDVTFAAFFIVTRKGLGVHACIVS